MEHDIDKLASLIRGLQHAIAKLATDNHTEELMRIIHKPGWTTPAEFGLMAAGLEAAQSHAETLARQLRGLTAGAAGRLARLPDGAGSANPSKEMRHPSKGDAGIGRPAPSR